MTKPAALGSLEIGQKFTSRTVQKDGKVEECNYQKISEAAANDLDKNEQIAFKDWCLCYPY